MWLTQPVFDNQYKNKLCPCFSPSFPVLSYCACRSGSCNYPYSKRNSKRNSKLQTNLRISAQLYTVLMYSVRSSSSSCTYFLFGSGFDGASLNYELATSKPEPNNEIREVKNTLMSCRREFLINLKLNNKNYLYKHNWIWADRFGIGRALARKQHILTLQLSACSRWRIMIHDDEAIAWCGALSRWKMR